MNHGRLVRAGGWGHPPLRVHCHC